MGAKVCAEKIMVVAGLTGGFNTEEAESAEQSGFDWTRNRIED